MSYILDALRRADHDRKLGHAPQADQLATPVEKAANPKLIPILLAVNAVVLLAIVIWFMHREPQEAGISANAESFTNQTTAEPAYASPPPEVLTTIPAEPAADNVREPVDGRPEPWAQAAVEELNPEIEPALPPSIEAVMVPEAAPEPVKKVPPPPTTAAEAEQIPELRDLPIEFRKTLPALEINTHFYSGNAARRFVIINLQKYREGDQVNGGPDLLEITSDGMLLEYRGRRFLVPR